MQSYLLLLGEFLLGKPSHFCRNPIWDLEFSMEDFTMQILHQVQLVMKIRHVDQQTTLVWNKLLCELCFVYRYTIDNRQWAFFALKMLLKFC